MGRGSTVPLSSALLYGSLSRRPRVPAVESAPIGDRGPLWWPPAEDEEHIPLEVTSSLLTFFFQDRQPAASEALMTRIGATMKMRIESVDNAVEALVAGVWEAMLDSDSRLILAHRWLGGSVGTVSVPAVSVPARFTGLELVDKSLDIEILDR